MIRFFLEIQNHERCIRLQESPKRMSPTSQGVLFLTMMERMLMDQSILTMDRAEVAAYFVKYESVFRKDGLTKEAIGGTVQEVLTRT